MFGEAESESPRTGSPWDGFLTSSGTNSPNSRELAPLSDRDVICTFPRLVPEVEEGNVEYKLHLISPSPARFARLVTQLKWRLLEGGGQALYEVGVADSGQLIGLSRSHLESSLSTLEEMAGEIGASVIVVKEIEVPEAAVQQIRKGGIQWRHHSIAAPVDGAMRAAKLRVDAPMSSPSLLEDVKEVTEDDDTDASSLLNDKSVDEDLFADLLELPFCPGLSERSSTSSSTSSSSTSLVTMPSKALPIKYGHPRQQHHQRSDPSRPSPLSSPLVFPADDEVDNSEPVDSVFSLDLEINSVYKPRPMRKRISSVLGPAAPFSPSTEIADSLDILDLGDELEALSLHSKRIAASRPPRPPLEDVLPVVPKVTSSPKGATRAKLVPLDMDKKISKKAKKRERRNVNRQRREQFKDGEYLFSMNQAELLAPVPVTVGASLQSEVLSLVPTPVAHAQSPALSDLDDEDEEDEVGSASPVSEVGEVVIAPDGDGAFGKDEDDGADGKRLFMVEVLVVRKLSVDEAFLDFEGFSILEV